MGLDMYLIRKKYIGGNYEHNKVKGNIEIEARGKKIPIDVNKLTYIEEDVGYWRKANQIHKWFVDNVQDGNDDCNYYDVDIKQLQDLLDICKEIKRKVKLKEGYIKNGQTLKDGEFQDVYEDGKFIENPEVCEELLPTGSGFFFGSTDYDEYYMEDIQHTIEVLEKVIKEEKEMNENGIYTYIQYHGSW